MKNTMLLIAKVCLKHSSIFVVIWTRLTTIDLVKDATFDKDQDYNNHPKDQEHYADNTKGM